MKAIYVTLLQSFQSTSATNHAHGQGLITLIYVTCYFEAYSDRTKHYENKLVLVIPLNEEAHVKVYAIKIEPKYQCMGLFCKY